MSRSHVLDSQPSSQQTGLGPKISLSHRVPEVARVANHISDCLHAHVGDYPPYNDTELELHNPSDPSHLTILMAVCLPFLSDQVFRVLPKNLQGRLENEIWCHINDCGRDGVSGIADYIPHHARPLPDASTTSTKIIQAANSSYTDPWPGPDLVVLEGNKIAKIVRGWKTGFVQKALDILGQHGALKGTTLVEQWYNRAAWNKEMDLLDISVAIPSRFTEDLSFIRLLENSLCENGERSCLRGVGSGRTPFKNLKAGESESLHRQHLGGVEHDMHVPKHSEGEDDSQEETM